MRLLTRADFDGLVCGAILKHVGIVDSWRFVHPKDVQDGKVEVTDNDVLANIPYAKGCGLWFDHHATEINRMGRDNVCPGDCRLAPSAARVVYDYYGGSEKLSHFSSLVGICDRVDSGDLTAEEILNPAGGVLLGFIMDPRTGLGRFRDFTISNYDLMSELLDRCASLSVEEILALPDVQERVEVYHEQSELFRKMLLANSRIEGKVIITDLRGIEKINAGNRFTIYSLFPEGVVSIWVVDGRQKQNVSIAIGYSVVNRQCRSDIGAICSKHGGGGHHNVGTCQVDYDKADAAIKEIAATLGIENP
ncbi:MAG: exopolyphosphatase [Oscillospiraceae bacterium]|jgi:nanoRNase/pAp phosphatase (c-di-AMP/oligoRNAs hydrolase)|nr:exopolyphosphatase [Oscillospiraceae bacterium]